MKRIISVILVCILMMSLLTACGKKPITAEEFHSKAQAAGAQINDTTSSADNTAVDYVNQALVATHTDGWTVSFYVFSDEDHAKTEFESFKAQIDQIIPESSSNSSVTATHYKTYSITGGTTYMHLAYVENTMLLAEANSSNTDAVKALIKELNY